LLGYSTGNDESQLQMTLKSPIDIVLSGGTGYLGSLVKESLIVNGFKVITLDNRDIDNPVDLSDSSSFSTLELPRKYLFIHLAFLLPGATSKENFKAKILRINSNIIKNLHPEKTLLISSTAVYALSKKQMHVEPWEIYGEMKLATESFFLKNLENLTIFRPGTLIEKERKSMMMKFLLQLRRSPFPILPSNGEFSHPFTYTPDLVQSIITWAKQQDNLDGIYNLVAQNPITFKQICEMKPRAKILAKIPFPVALFRILGSDKIPIFGISKWHFNALTYNLESMDKNFYNSNSSNYETIFRKL
jgi:nucleoside-diphosphate-sugar epimerase